MFISTFGDTFKHPGEFTDETVKELLEQSCRSFDTTAARNLQVISWTADTPNDWAKDFNRRAKYPLLVSGSALLFHKTEHTNGWARTFHLFEIREREADLYTLDSPHGWVETFVHLPEDHRERAFQAGQEARERHRTERIERQSEL